MQRQLEIYQWLVPLIALFFIARTLRQYALQRRSVRGTLIWLAFWAATIVLAIVPNWISFKIARMLGFKSNVNAIIFVGLGLLFLLVFFLSTTVTRLEDKLTELVRQLAKEREEREREREQMQKEGLSDKKA